MSDPGTRAFLGIYLVTCLIVYQREMAIAAPSEEIINRIAYLCCRPTSAACQSTQSARTHSGMDASSDVAHSPRCHHVILLLYAINVVSKFSSVLTVALAYVQFAFFFFLSVFS